MSAGHWVYLDNNATTRMDEQVLQAMLPYLRHEYGNPSSIHSFGARLQPVLDQAREHVASLIGAEPGEIVFTSGGTESDNWALHAGVTSRGGRRGLVTSAVEHHAVLHAAEALKRQGAADVRIVGVAPDGTLRMDELAAGIGPETAIVSLMHANNETGVLFDLPSAVHTVRQIEPRAWFHTDATQTLGKLPVDVRAMGVDLLTGSGHKLHGPKGIGFLYIRRSIRLRPLLVGGPQNRERRAGTEHVAGIVGLGEACRLARERLEADTRRVRAMRHRLESGLLAAIEGCRINGHAADRLPNTCNIGFSGVEAEPLLILLSQAQIAASAGSACTSGSLEPSHVLAAMGVPTEFAHGSIRLSLSRETSEAEIDRVVSLLPGMVARLRGLNEPLTRRPERV